MQIYFDETKKYKKDQKEMHIEIDKLYFNGDKMGVDFEYDEDFCHKVADICGVETLTKKELQSFVIGAMRNVITSEDIEELKKQVES